MDVAVAMVDVVMPLRRAVDAVGPVQAGVEPLRRVRRGHLRAPACSRSRRGRRGRRLRCRSSRPSSPSRSSRRPGGGTPARALRLAAEPLGLGQRGERDVVGPRAPQPLRHVRFGDLDEAGRDAGPAEILLREDVGGDLRPVGRHVDALRLKNDRAVGIADFGVGSTKSHSFEWRFSCLRIPTLEAHRRSPVPSSRHLFPSGVCSISIRARTYGHRRILNYKILCAQLHFVDHGVDDTR